MSALGEIGFLEEEMELRTETSKGFAEMFGLSQAKALGVRGSAVVSLCSGEQGGPTCLFLVGKRPTSHSQLMFKPLKLSPCFLFSTDDFALHFTEQKRITKWQQRHPPP